MVDSTGDRRDETRRGGVVTRRSLLKGGLALGATAVAGKGLTLGQGRLVERLTGISDTSFSPGSVKHVVILMQENRSFDHYFGTLEGVTGFDDANVGKYATGINQTPFQQVWPATQGAWPWTGWEGPGFLEPWKLVSNFPYQNGQSTNDITHDWTPQHRSYDGGLMDQWLVQHALNDRNKNPLPDPFASASSNDGYMTMGYLTGSDLAFYHALAEAFTICDGYFCSVLGPTDPNRLMLMSNSVGVGQNNGPLLTTLTERTPQGFAWTTMPEWVREVVPAAAPGTTSSWRVYGDPTAQYLFNVLQYFTQYQSDPDLAANAFGFGYPDHFAADVAAGTLPAVSWILPPATDCEHPAAPPSGGEYLVSQILQTLSSNRTVWEQTVFFVVYDENGGWFDHVPPPTAPSSAAGEGEYVTGLSASGYDDGPVGLGFRVPCLVLSPWTVGGFVCSPYYTDATTGLTHLDPAGTFDHTSLNRFIAAVLGADLSRNPLPNLSSWRQGVTGDFTTAFAGTYPGSVPTNLPPTAPVDSTTTTQAVVNGVLGTEDYAPLPYPAPTDNPTSFPPLQETASFTPTYKPPAS